MQIQLVRNATLKVEYARRHFLFDPYLAAKFSRPSFSGKSLNPTVDLPMPPVDVISGVEAILLSHSHSDHFDPAAQALLPRNLPVFCQPSDQMLLQKLGFVRIHTVDEKIGWEGIGITRTSGRHGSGEVLEEMGTVSGFVLQAEDEPTLYWAGDTIWFEGIESILQTFQPEVILTHSCGAVWGQDTLITMDAEQTVAVCHAAPQATVVAIHMEALDHATITRSDLRGYAEKHMVPAYRLKIPLDGEILRFS